MIRNDSFSRLISGTVPAFLLIIILARTPVWGRVPLVAVSPMPAALVVYDGPDRGDNPGRLDALYLANLLGHFTTRRQVKSLAEYVPGEYKRYDAVFCIIYQRRYTVPSAFLRDVDKDRGIFCWLGNQVVQLEALGTLQRHGIAFTGFSDRIRINQVFYKSRVLVKGDPEINFLKVTDPGRVRVIATAGGPDRHNIPYVLRNGSFWVVADSPFSYSSENDRYLVFADVLHDILQINHPEQHRAILRIEDINALSEPAELEATLQVIRKRHIPFAFGFVPAYVNPHERLEMHLSDRPEVVSVLKKYAAAGGTPVLHGYTHQYRGVTTDDYEFWDDLGDRPVRGDSEEFVARRLEEAVSESMNLGLYPVTWETPHYAASPLDYRVMHRYFDTLYERRLVGSQLGTDQYFPYPVIDLYGQYLIPENLAYIPLDNPTAAPILANAEAAGVVRDGYASVFFHPFLKPELLDQVIHGIEQRGFTFMDLRDFPNQVHAGGRLITNAGGAVIAGHGRYLNERIIGSRGEVRQNKSVEVAADAILHHAIQLQEGETYVALRQDVPPPSLFQKLLQVAKGNLSVLHRRWETVFPGHVPHDPVKTAILWNPLARGAEARDQESFEMALSSIGFDVNRVEYQRLSQSELGPVGLLVIPQAAARCLAPDTVKRVLRAVGSGITLVTDGQSALASGLGVRLGDAAPVGDLTDHLFVSQETHWADRPRVPWIAEPRPEGSTVYYSDRELQHPLVISIDYGEGRYLYYAPLFDPDSGRGYARFPNLPQILINELQLSPLLRSQAVDAYFDPGYRQAISIEVLAKMWRRFGIRAVHAAAWTFYEKYAYDYARLVKVCHQNGILVYAWFEWPEVSQRFWDRHPGWREKTALQTDAQVDWRYLMNLQDPECLQAVLADLKTFLKAYDWDGVDIGELTFESLEGPINPGTFTPFNHQAREEFQRLRGFDPADLFRDSSPHYWEDHPGDLQQFYQYRQQVNARLLKTFLSALRQVDQETHRQGEVLVTVLDVLQHPKLGNYLGIDLPQTLALLKEYGATLEVEDPSEDWSLPPERYARLGKRYAQLGMPQPFMIDINVLPVHPASQRGFATARPTGVEVAQLYRTAAEHAPRVCLYSESSVQEQDWEILPYVTAADATVRKEGDNWVVSSPKTVILELGQGTHKYRLDGQPWFCAGKGEILIPPGEHTVSFTRAQHAWFDTAELETRLLSLSGELLGSQRISRGLEIEYASPTRCALLFNKLPFALQVDGRPFKAAAIRGDDGFTILAPPGQHRLRVVTESVGLYLVEFTSLVLASLIVLFGLASSGLLAVLFLFITLHRRVRRIRQFFR